MKSIMQEKNGTCYLCERYYGDYSQKVTEEHHAIFGAGNRKLSERYGLKVYLCVGHHRASNEAVHMNEQVRREVSEDAQRAFERKYPDLSFLEIFGKNYIEHEEEEQQAEEEFGFMFLDEAI